MPRRTTHDAAGLISGVVAAGVKAKQADGLLVLMELLGGAWGGVQGARIPDVLEPATCPGHRKFAHSWTMFVQMLGTSLKAARAECRRLAENCSARAVDPTLSPAMQLAYTLGALFWSFCAGALTGMKAGYASHLALDSCTVQGLPLLGLAAARACPAVKLGAPPPASW